MSNVTSELGSDRRDATGHDRLDRERAASMADEGGVSGAITETREQLAVLQQHVDRQRAWRVRWLWGAVAVGCALFAGALVARSVRS